MSMKLLLQHLLTKCVEIVLKTKLSVANFAAINTSMVENFAQHSANDASIATK